ncbi:MAG: hypothetical protein LUF30_03195 [Lachnospiraceae bacterium]|nr:hypothetical protein [Lachnospiraceae bacterium]
MNGDWKREHGRNPETCRINRFDKEYQQIRKDNLRYMKGVILARYFYDLLSIAIPTVIACLVGDMADYLLALDREKIYAVLPNFLLALDVKSLGAPRANLVQYQPMIKQSFAYDECMMNLFIHKPLRDIERQGIGEILERLGGDLGDFSWNTVILISAPLVIISYGTVLVWTLLRSGVTPPFLVLLLMISGLPVLKAQMTAGKKSDISAEAF